MITNALFEKPYITLAIFSLSLTVLSTVALHYIDQASLQCYSFVGLGSVSCLSFCLINVWLWNERKKMAQKNKIEVHKASRITASSLRPESISKPSQVLVPKAVHLTEVSLSYSPPSSPVSSSSSSSSMSTTVQTPPISERAQRLAREQTLAINAAMPGFVASVEGFACALLKQYQKGTISEKDKTVIAEACHKLPQEIMGVLDLESICETGVISYFMPIFGMKDFVYLLDIAGKLNNNAALKTLNSLRDTYKDLTAKLNMCGYVLLYLRNLMSIAEALQQAGHTFHIEELNKLKAQRAGLDDFIVKKVPNLNVEEARGALIDFFYKLADPDTLTHIWGFNLSQIEEIAKKVPKIKKVPIRLLNLQAIKRSMVATLYNIEDEYIYYFFRQLFHLIPKVQIHLNQDSAFRIIINKILPTLQLFVTKNTLLTPLTEYFKINMLLQALMAGSFDEIEKMQKEGKITLQAVEFSQTDQEQLKWISRLDKASKFPGAWKLVDYVLTKEGVRQQIDLLPRIVGVLFKPLYHLKRPGKFRESMLPIVSNLNPLLEDLGKESIKPTLEIASVLGCFQKYFDQMRLAIEAMK